jgi:hypothetical protein
MRSRRMLRAGAWRMSTLCPRRCWRRRRWMRRAGWPRWPRLLEAR